MKDFVHFGFMAAILYALLVLVAREPVKVEIPVPAQTTPQVAPESQKNPGSPEILPSSPPKAPEKAKEEKEDDEDKKSDEKKDKEEDEESSEGEDTCYVGEAKKRNFAQVTEAEYRALEQDLVNCVNDCKAKNSCASGGALDNGTCYCQVSSMWGSKGSLWVLYEDLKQE